MARRILMAVRSGPNEPDIEAEPVLLETDGRDVTLTLDDGEEITMDVEQLRQELASATLEAQAERAPRRLAA